MTPMESQSIKRYMLFIAAGSLIVSVASAAVAGARAGRAEAESQMRGIAHDVVREEWLSTLAEETKRIAADAARDAADRAIREAVVPLAVEQTKNVATDEVEHRSLDRRITRLEEHAAKR